MIKIKSKNFSVTGEDNGDDEVAAFIESCHPEFFKQRLDLQQGLIDEMGYELLVKVEVELIKIED